MLHIPVSANTVKVVVEESVSASLSAVHVSTDSVALAGIQSQTTAAQPAKLLPFLVCNAGASDEGLDGDGRAFAATLKTAGVDVTYHVVPDVRITSPPLPPSAPF
jgi:hypothetical protein